jgi:cyclophilin family peptidyl-prolyl cis-trans isomerase
MKKPVALLFLVLVLIATGGCAPMDDAKKVIAGKDGVFALMETSRGIIVLELFYKQTPLTVTNFVGLAEGTLSAANGKPFYNGLKFHRVISKGNGDDQDFMIQGGDPKGNGTGGPGYQFADEFVDSLKFNKAGLLAMANSGPATNGSQFFITIVPTDWLSGKHTIFGQVLGNGQEIVNATKQGDLIKSITIVRQGADAAKFSATQKDFDALASAAAKKTSDAAARRAGSANAASQLLSGATRSPEGIYYLTTKEGKGNKTGLGKSVSVQYKGYFLDRTVFDSSEGRAPLDFTTGREQMIKGFDKMVQDMKLNEKRTFVLPPAEAYGANGAGGVIPPNAYIVFDVELVRIQ